MPGRLKYYTSLSLRALCLHVSYPLILHLHKRGLDSAVLVDRKQQLNAAVGAHCHPLHLSELCT